MDENLDEAKTLEFMDKCILDPKWVWLPGMKAVGRKGLPKAWFRLEEETRRLYGDLAVARPDWSDPATLGALLHHVRRTWASPDRLWNGHVEVHRDHRNLYFVVQPYHDEEGGLAYHTLATGKTEAEALLRALVREGD
jgi:hypothetical protein